MRFAKMSTASLAVLFILGCSPKETAPPPPPPPPQSTVFDPLTQQLGKAKDVQKAADANADANRNAVDQQERGDSSN